MDFHITHVKKECPLRGTNRTTVEKGLQILNTRCPYYVTLRVFLKTPIVSHIFTHTLTPTPTPVCEKKLFPPPRQVRNIPAYTDKSQE